MEKEGFFDGDLKHHLQNYLSLGYLLLLSLGIIRDAVFFGFLDINILSYASVLDVLMSPLVYMINNIIIPIVFILIMILAYKGGSYQLKWHERHKHKKWYQRLFNVEKLDEKYGQRKDNSFILVFGALFLLSFYLGTGIGGGSKAKQQLKNGTYKIENRLIFNDGEVLPVKIFGNNSTYVFYVAQGDSTISISPIQSNIKKIEKLSESN